MKIKFDEESHTYTHKDTKERFISVTTLLGKYKQPFDSAYWSDKKAQERGILKEEILKEWKYKASPKKTANYTKPYLRQKLFLQIKAAKTHGTKANQWSARKAQLLAKKYKQMGGDYY